MNLLSGPIGGLMWILQGVLASIPAAPQDTLIARGHWGQFLIIMPSLKLVLVRNGWDRGGIKIDANRMLELLLGSVQ